MNKSSFVTLAVIIIILLAGAASVFFVKEKNRLAETGSEATRTLTTTEDTPYTDLDGNPFSFDAYTNTVRVVNAWASWCPFCTQELADFETLATEFKDQGVTVIAVNRKEPKERAKYFLSTLGEFNNIHFAIDLTDAYYASIGGFSMPETVFYDTAGNIVVHKRGFMSLEEMRTHTQAAINATIE